jgi:hypothetical protein
MYNVVDYSTLKVGYILERIGADPCRIILPGKLRVAEVIGNPDSNVIRAVQFELEGNGISERVGIDIPKVMLDGFRRHNSHPRF